MMASTKKLVYKVETKLATDRKRRNSDLVIMWQSIWYATEFILKELWIILMRMWELFQLWFISSERFEIQAWLEKYIPYVPEDFSESWRDGRLLAMLLNNLRPGCFPDAKRLDPDYGLKNVYRVFDTLEVHFAIKPNVSVEEIVTCIDGSDAKLFEILVELKNFTDKQPEKEEPKPEPKERIEQPIVIESCIAKGSGLTAGIVGKVANFTLHCEVMSDLDVVIEVRGPSSICGERITKRSPKKKRSCCSLDNSRHLTRSLSFNADCHGLVTEEEDNLGKRIIPFTYEIVGSNINLSYKPIEKGIHKVTILWHGRHVSESPYFVATVDPLEISDMNKLVHLKSALKAPNECGKSDKGENNRRKISVRFQENTVNRKEQNNVSVKIVSRRVIRYIVKIYGKDIPVNAENTQALATELLKMDYNFEKCPSFHRRNSWGFVGDAERKKSVIRQFCIDVNELDAQISHRRSHSLSLNPGSKKLLQKYDSLENLSSHLNILSEDSFEDKAHEKEEDYAYINEDLPDEKKIVNEIRDSDNDSTKNEFYTENKAFELSSAAAKMENSTDLCEDKKLVEEKKYDFLCATENISYEGNKIERIIHSDLDEIKYQSNTDKETNDLPSELAEGKLVEESKENNPNCDKDIDMISSLSTDDDFTKRIDSSNEDRKSRILPCSSLLDVNKRTGNDIEEISLCHGPEMKMHPEDQSSKQSDSRFSTLQLTLNSKVVRKNSKMKKHSNVKYDLSRFLKKCKTKNKSEYPSVQTFYRKSSNDKKSINQSPIRILRRKQKSSRRNIETNKVVPIINGNILNVRNFISPMQQKLENYCDTFFCNESTDSKNVLSEYSTNVSINEENDESIFETKYAQTNEQRIISTKTCTFKNLLSCPIAEIGSGESQNLVHEPVIKKSECNLNITATQTTLSNNSENKNSSSDNSIQPQTDNRKRIGQFYINHSSSSQFTSTESESDGKGANIEGTVPLRTHTLKTIGKFDFRQFSPPFETQSSISPVKLQIGLWESALSAEKHSSVEKASSSDSEQVNIKKKLAFWENAYKTEQKLSEQKTPRNSRKTSSIRSQKSCTTFDDDSEVLNNDLCDLRFKGLYSGTLFSSTQDKIESYNSMNKDTNVVAKKLSDDKVSTEFQLPPPNVRSRSFDDFVTRGTIRTIITETPLGISDNSSSQESSKIEFSSASIDDNLENYDSDHTEDSGGDYLIPSTGDEYIDDEIPESASEYWGDLSIVEGWKTQRSSDTDSFLQEQFLREFHQRNKFHTYPEECKVFGIAVYYGHVAVKNRFKVYTGDAGYGNLSVSMQGFRQHDVSLVSVTYMRNNIYEVTYQIMTTGYYLISIRWLDKEIPGSPFVCKVTF